MKQPILPKNSVSKPSPNTEVCLSDPDNDYFALQRTIAEKNILLSLSKDLLNLEDKSDILRIIYPKLKLLFNTEDIFIGFLDNNGENIDTVMRVRFEQRLTQPEYETKTKVNASINDIFIKEVLHSVDSIIYNINKLPEPLKCMGFPIDHSLVEPLAVRLQNGPNAMGLLMLWSETKNYFSEKHKKLLEDISIEISGAIAKLIANEEIVKKDEEKSILLSLSMEIAAVRNKNDLLPILQSKLPDLFPITGFGITLANEDGKTHYPFVVDPSEKTKKDTDFKEVITQCYDIEDGVYNTIIKSTRPIALNVEKLASAPNAPQYVSFWKKKGIDNIMGIPLRVSNSNLGCLIFHLNSDLNSKTINDSLLLGVCAQVSVAISNILSNLEITKREQEKTILLSLSNEIASLKSREDLYEVVNGKIKQIFPITEYGICKVNEDLITHSAFMLDFGDKITNPKEFAHVKTIKFSIYDTVYGSLKDSTEPVLIDVEELAKEIDAPYYIKFCNEVGFKKNLFLGLRSRGNLIGFIFFNILESEVKNLKTNLLKAVCSQLAVAVSNILANEDILRREEEKSILLSLSHEIAALRNKGDFLHVVSRSLKTIFSIQEIGIAKLNEDRTKYSEFVLDMNGPLKNHNGFQRITFDQFDVSDQVCSSILNSENPVIFNVEQLLEQDQIPVYVDMWKQAGLKYVLGMALRVGGKNIGFITLHYYTSEPFDIKNSLIKGVCAQLALAMSNILANEEIAKQEQEKSILLSLSHEIASLNNREDFFKIVNTRFKELFCVGEFGIAQINEDRNTMSTFAMDIASEYSKYRKFSASVPEEFPITDKIMDRVLKSEVAVIFDVQKIAEDPEMPIYVDFWKSLGIYQILAMAVRVGGKNVGAIFLHNYTKSPFNINTTLLNGICAQLALAISNIVANEKVLQQLEQINKYKEELEEEKIYLQEEIETSKNYSEIIGESNEIKKVFKLISQVAPSNSTVLLQGETGTGKELIARAIHNGSPRKSKLMVKVNCAALPSNLIESELFGHEKGSFTGAYERRIGKFELANNGTLFLDEIGEMPLELQSKLLRALQEKEIERLGGKTTIKTDVRIIAATNRNLEKLMEEGLFRSDLYYRLNIFPISLPSLRNRREDIQPLTQFFIKRYSKKTGIQINNLSAKAMQELIKYDWPGNIRELEHFIERSVLLATSSTIKEIHLPNQKAKFISDAINEDGTILTIDENEKQHILRILKLANGKIGGTGGAAELLGVPTSTLNSKIKRLGITKEHVG